jgi:hypothetical protein
MVLECHSFLTATEIEFLNGKEFPNYKVRYIRCRLRKKLAMLQQELDGCNVALNKRCGSNASNRPNDKNGRFYAPLSIAACNYDAPWSGAK